MSITNNLAESLVGLTLAEAFGKFVASDTEVKSLAKEARDASDWPLHLPDLEMRYYFGQSYAWPVIGPPTFDQESPIGCLLNRESEAENNFMRVLADRLNAIVEPLQSGALVAAGHLGDGTLEMINKGIWSNSSYYCDFKESNVGKYSESEEDVTFPRFVPIWAGVEIREPHVSATLEEKDAVTHPTDELKFTPAEEALHKALPLAYPEGVPPSIGIKLRNYNINKKIEGRVRWPYSDKTIQRYFVKIKKRRDTARHSI